MQPSTKRIVVSAWIIATVLLIVGIALFWGISSADKGRPLSEAEITAIGADRLLVERWASSCLRLSSTSKPPAALKIQWDASDASAPEIDASTVNGAYFRAIAINNALEQRRKAFAQNWSLAFVRAQFAIWASVIVGLLTTAFVALSSTELVDKATGKGLWIRIVAITLPAIGTAVAGLTAFYEPSANLAAIKGQATAAEQLHIQMGQDVWKVGCLGGPTKDLSDQQKVVFDGWSQRFQELVARGGSGQQSTATPGGDVRAGSQAKQR